MNTDEDGMSHVCPQRGIAHTDMIDTSLKTFSRGISRGAIVTVATEHTVVEDMGRGKDIQPVSPPWVRDATHVAQSNAIGTTHRTSIQYETVDKHVFAAIDMTTLIATRWTGDTPAEDAHVLCIVYGKRTCEITA